MVVPIVNGGDIEDSDFTGTRYRIINPHLFIPQNNARVTMNINYIGTTTAGTNAFHAPILLPDGCTLTDVKLYFDRNDGASSANWAIVKIAKDNSGSVPTYIMVSANITHTSGVAELDSGALAEVIDNNANYYALYITIQVNDSALDAIIHSAVLTYTITHPKP